MKTLIVYDSIFGNTEKIALAIKDALSSKDTVEAYRVKNLTEEKLNGVKLLIVGSPTRGFRPTKDISNFIKKLPNNSLKGIKTAAFDTRLSLADVKSKLLNILVKIFGYAAKPIADALRKKGGEVIIFPEGFFVKDSKGPLKDGEIKRASDWAKKFG